MMKNKLVIVVGQEGAGKSAVVRALLPRTDPGAQIDAEDLGQINPFSFDDHFKQLLWKNVAMLTRNYWSAGISTVIAGSFINDYKDYKGFRTHLTEKVDIYLIHLCTSKPTRDKRRIDRSKPSTQEWRDWLDEHHPEDISLRMADADYRYIRVENSELSLDETVDQIVASIPNVYARQHGS